MPRHSDATLAAIKNAIDIVALVGDSLPLHRVGSKFKALCPFHDDHNPSLELNPDRQSFKCWSCGAGGDIFDFVMEYERVDFPEALRMLAERANVALDMPVAGPAPSGPTKSELLAVHAWAEQVFARELSRAPEVLAYLEGRGLSAQSIERFGLGYAPEGHGWLIGQARPAGYGPELLEKAGLVARPADGDGPLRDRFRGRVLFPIRDIRGRAIGFGGRILPDVAARMAEAGRNVAKYLNTPETPLFQKRRNLYAVDLARDSARQAGWVAVVEGYTDVIAAHQVGLANVVGTLGTALGADHIQLLRRLADRVVLVFDGDEAGQKAADRGLELFLNHELDVRVLTLPAGQDPCDYLLSSGAESFRARVEQAADPLDFVVNRAVSMFDIDEVDGARRAAEHVLDMLARLPGHGHRAGLDLKAAKALDHLSRRLRLPVETLRRDLSKRRRPDRSAQNHVQLKSRVGDEAGRTLADGALPPMIPLADLNRLDRELIEILLNEPTAVGRVITRVEVASLRDAPLRAVLQVCYDLHGEGQPVTFNTVTARLDDPALRKLAADLVAPIDPRPMSERYQNQRFVPQPWSVRLANLMPQLAERTRLDRLRDLNGALAEIDPTAEADVYRALWQEKLRLLTQRPAAKSSTMSDAS